MSSDPGPTGASQRRCRGDSRRPVVGNADITVAGQDITGIVLELHRGVTISGQLVFQATTLTAAR